MLKYGDDFETDTSKLHSRSRAAIYNFNDPGLLPEPSVVQIPADLQRKSTVTPAQSLKDLLHAHHADPSQGSKKELIVLEGLNPEFVSVIGHAWQVDPRVFMDHQLNLTWNTAREGASSFHLPSTMGKSKFSVQYQELRYFTETVPSHLLRAADSFRNIGTTSIGRQKFQTGVVSRKISYWSRRQSKGGWQGRARF